MINEESRMVIVEKVKALLPEIKQAEKKKIEVQAWFEKVGNTFKTPEVKEMMGKNKELIPTQGDINLDHYSYYSRDTITKNLSEKILRISYDDLGDLYEFKLKAFDFPNFLFEESTFKTIFGEETYKEEVEKFKKKYEELQAEGKKLLESLIHTRNKATKKLQHLWSIISREDLTLAKLKTYCPTLYDLYKK